MVQQFCNLFMPLHYTVPSTAHSLGMLISFNTMWFMSCIALLCLLTQALCVRTITLGDNKKTHEWGAMPSSLLGSAMPMNINAHETFDNGTSPWVQQIGLRPRSYYFHNFLTEQERRHMLKLAYPDMKRSTVAGKHGESVVDEIRTSYGMFIRRLQDPVIERIEKRIALWTQLPIEHQEDIQVLRYVEGQKYGAHYDSAGSKDDAGPKFRMATMLMYLSDVEEGGETAFPMNSVWYDPSLANKPGTVSECADGHVAAKPKAGDAVLFYSFHPNGTMDDASMHTGCPVIKGIKWAAPVWIHVDEFRPEEFRQRQAERKAASYKNQVERDPGQCADYNPNCARWAAAGSCKDNPGFMVGDENTLGQCRKSCNACESCMPHEWDCINRNRARGGYLKLDRSELEWLGVESLMAGTTPSPEL